MDNIIVFIQVFFYLLNILILIRVIMSWVRPLYNSPFGAYIYQSTEFLMYPVRLLFDKLGISGGLIDWTPMVTLIFLSGFEWVLIKIILHYL